MCVCDKFRVLIYRVLYRHQYILAGFHGTSGPWKTNWAYGHPIQNVILSAAKELGFQVTEDINGEQMESKFSVIIGFP